MSFGNIGKKNPEELAHGENVKWGEDGTGSGNIWRETIGKHGGMNQAIDLVRREWEKTSRGLHAPGAYTKQKGGVRKQTQRPE